MALMPHYLLDILQIQKIREGNFSKHPSPTQLNSNIQNVLHPAVYYLIYSQQLLAWTRVLFPRTGILC